MELFAALSLGWIELSFLTVFFLLLVLGTAYDRNDFESPKWYIFNVGFILIAAYFWKDWTINSVWNGVTSWMFWKPVVVYLGLGLVYSIIEFLLDIRRSVSFYAAEWKKHLASNNALELYRDVCEKGPLTNNFNKALEMTRSFINNYNYRNCIIQIVPDKNSKFTPVPQVNNVQLAEHIGAWTFFWPFYFVSLIFGDLLKEMFRIIADFLTHISARLIRVSFANVFKF